MRGLRKLILLSLLRDRGRGGDDVGRGARRPAGRETASILFFACWATLNGAMLLAQPLWADGRFLTAFVILWFSLDTLITVATLPIAMRLCDRTVAATQFALYMALSNFGITIGAWLLGLADVLGGLGPLFWTLAAADLVAIGVLLTVRFPARQVEPAEIMTEGEPVPSVN